MPALNGFSPSITFAENAVNATPQVLDSDVVFTDAEGDFNGGTLTLTGLLAEDRASVRNEGTGAGQIGLNGASVTYGGIVIGTLAGGVGAALTVTLNAAATSVAIDALIQNLTYANVSDTPTTTRTLTLNVTDAAGNSLTTPTAYVERTGAANPFDGIDIGGFSAPVLVDLDGDGDLDLVVGELQGQIRTYRNGTSDAAGAFTALTGANNPFNSIDVGFVSRPTFEDIDGDGDLDLVVGRNNGQIAAYRNGTNGTAGAFTELTGASNPFNGFDSGAYSNPAFADLDGDGDRDLAVGDNLGQFAYFRNDAGVFTQLTGAANPLNGLTSGLYSAPTFADVDGDGDIDLLTSDSTSALTLYLDIGSTFTNGSGPGTLFNGISVGGNATPRFVDVDGDGDLDLIFGNNTGVIRYVENTASTQRIAVAITAQTDGTPGGDTFIGTAAAEVFSGGEGDDVVVARGGNDILNGGGGIDTIDYSDATGAVTVRLSTGVASDGEGGTDTLTGFENVNGGSGDDLLIADNQANSLNGGAGRDTLIGNGGNDVLRGGAGAANELYGGLGDDTYIVEAADTIVELADSGTDTVETARANLTLRANLENLTYTGASSFAGRGNDLDNIITGGVAADVLSGLGGNDTLIGGTGAANTLVGGVGDDTYVVSTRDTIVEAGGEGTDTVNVSLNYYGLAANVENLTFTGTGAFSGLGNASANVITGGTGADTLRGAGDDDTLNGGDGFDTADFTGQASEYTIENLGGGQYRVTDTVGGRDGTDMLNGMEQARFSDSRIVLGTIQPDVFPELSVKDAGAQVLPGMMDDDFLFRDTDLPLVLPGDGITSGVDDLLTVEGIVPFNQRPGFMLAVGDAGLMDHGGSVYDPGHDHWLY